jgi:hypothetical protein
MVIGDRFAWAHLPKTAGTATVAMFQAFDDLVRFADSPDDVDAHARFRERPQQIEGKLLVLNLRRLPAWVISRACYVSRHGVYPDFEPIPLPGPQALAESSFPDGRLELFTDGGRLEIDRWLRTESIEDDVVSFVSELRGVTDDERARVRQVGRVNSLDYERDVSRWFTPAQIEQLYRSNPVWAAVEERVYGNVLGKAFGKAYGKAAAFA